MANWDWVTISALATAVGTLVLALATFGSVRSANRAARIAERSMLQGLRPLLFPSRLTDEPIKVSFADQYVLQVPGGQGVLAVTADVIYLAMSLRNVGSGIAVLHGWVIEPTAVNSAQRPEHASLDRFRRLTRDLYIPHGDIFFWQGAIREATDPDFSGVVGAVDTETPITIELLYGDEEGGQRTVTRYTLMPHRHAEGRLNWLAGVSRHWNIDRPDPR
jgi:hypothetical protein